MKIAMIKSLCDVKKLWHFSRPVTKCTRQYYVLLNNHEVVIPKHMVISDNCLRACLKTVTTVLSLCPPRQQDGSEADRNDSPIKVTSSTKKKRRRILSDSDEQDVDASTRFVYYFKTCLYIISKLVHCE
jgi:hypothetical protein